MLNIVIGLNRGWDRTRSWHAFRMVCCHKVLSMQMAEVGWVWYCVTVAVVDGIDVMIACWNAWRLSDSFSSPQTLCKSCCLVISVPTAL